MDEFDVVLKKAADILNSVVKKSGEIVENTRISYNLSVEREKIAKLKLKIGEKVYDMHKNGEELPDKFSEELDAIGEMEENIRNLEKKHAECNKYIVCTECSSRLAVNSVYCPRCGHKLASTE